MFPPPELARQPRKQPRCDGGTFGGIFGRWMFYIIVVIDVFNLISWSPPPSTTFSFFLLRAVGLFGISDSIPRILDSAPDQFSALFKGVVFKMGVSSGCLGLGVTEQLAGNE